MTRAFERDSGRVSIWQFVHSCWYKTVIEGLRRERSSPPTAGFVDVLVHRQIPATEKAFVPLQLIPCILWSSTGQHHNIGLRALLFLLVHIYLLFYSCPISSSLCSISRLLSSLQTTAGRYIVCLHGFYYCLGILSLASFE